MCQVGARSVGGMGFSESYTARYKHTMSDTMCVQRMMQNDAQIFLCAEHPDMPHATAIFVELTEHITAQTYIHDGCRNPVISTLYTVFTSLNSDSRDQNQTSAGQVADRLSFGCQTHKITTSAKEWKPPC